MNGHIIGFCPQTQKLELHPKQIAPCESTGRELSFVWSHHRISSTDSRVRVTLQNSIKHSGSERVKREHDYIETSLIIEKVGLTVK